MCIFTSHFINLFFLNFFFLAFVRLGPRLGKFFTHVIKNTQNVLRSLDLSFLKASGMNSLTRRSGDAF